MFSRDRCGWCRGMRPCRKAGEDIWVSANLRRRLRDELLFRGVIRVLMPSSSDDHFDPKTELLSLGEEQAIAYAKKFIDQNCEQKDASFLTEVISAGEKSAEVTYQHAVDGSPIAQLVFGTAKLNGFHTEQSTSEGLFWLVRSFNNGNPKAAIVLAGTFIEGCRVTKNVQKAYKFASFAAGRDLPAGQYILANLLIGGGEILEDQERAIDLLKASAKSGYAPALQMLEDNDIPLD